MLTPSQDTRDKARLLFKLTKYITLGTKILKGKVEI